jgi:hypothetical protein
VEISMPGTAGRPYLTATSNATGADCGRLWENAGFDPLQL